MSGKTVSRSQESDEASYSNVELMERSVLKIGELISLEWIFYLEDNNKTFSMQQLFAIKYMNPLFSTEC